jgi:hypothetical protein
MDVTSLEQEQKGELIESILDGISDKCDEEANKFNSSREAGPYTRKLVGYVYNKELWRNEGQYALADAFTQVFAMLDAGKPFWQEEELAQHLLRGRA